MGNQRLNQLFEFLETSPNDPFILYAIASEYMKLKDFDKAQDYFQELLVKRPDYVGTYYHFGKLYELMGRPDDALDIYSNGMLVAKKANDLHAFSELQMVYNSVLGIEPDDDDW